jgi:SNF2 family DNA or RNA helicase
MNILHAFWHPEPTDAFLQDGDLQLWVESDRTAGNAVATSRHPRQLSAHDLSACLAELNIAIPAGQCASHALALPSLGDAPLPCPELAPYLDTDYGSGEPGLREWIVDCCPVREHPIAQLNELHFQTLLQHSTLRPGGDFLFWHWFTQSLKAVLYKDGFIPALRLRRAKKTAYELYAGWEIISAAYEDLLREAVERMPPSAAPGYEPLSLLSHCAEVLTHRAIRQTKLTQALDKKIDGTLVEASFAQSGDRPWLATNDLSLYQSWLNWRYKLAGRQREAGFQLCLQLHEAASGTPENWRLEFRVAAAHDPSRQLALGDYWELAEKARLALAKTFGAEFEKSLLLRLGQAARIYPALWKGLETGEPTGLDLTLEEAFGFLNESAWVLQDSGFTIIVPAWWTPQGRRRAKLKMRGSGSAKKASSSAGTSKLSLANLLQYRYELTLGGDAVSPAEWQQLVDAKTPLVQFRGQWVALDRDKMQEMLAFWKAQGDGAQTLDPRELLQRLADDAEFFEIDPQDALAAMLEKLRDAHRLEPIANPPQLNATLREYQKRGVAWLRLLEQLGLSGCLADDMGLGKTIQVITHLLLEKAESGPTSPTLLVAPTSVLGNWRKEIERFAPDLSTHIHHGGERSTEQAALRGQCQATDVVITSYTLLRKDVKLFAALPWRRIVLDEAQNIKNPVAAQTKAVLSLKACHRIALTGTPVENRLLDLWSILNFLNPGYLDKQAQFRKRYELPIQRDNDLRASQHLRKLVEPFILRRVKTDPAIIQDLPDKVENRQFCNLSREQASLYEAVVKDVEQQLADSEGIQRQGLMLSTLMKLKQICNHPAQFLQDGSPFTQERSNKLERLLDMLGEVIAEGESALVFSQFTDIGEQLERQAKTQLQCQTYYLHGGTARSRREQMIERFQDPESPPAVFILSLKAGGVGITLTRANHVFHFDRWWNPAVEDQATDRAFRIGQTRNVFVHKFVTLGTLEERIDQMIEDKKKLAGSIVGSDESWLAQLDNAAFKQLIALNRRQAIGN